MKEKSYALLEKLGVEYKKIEHPPLLTCEDGKLHRAIGDELQVKNLFLQNKNKSNFYLVVLPADKRADLNQIREALMESKLSFAGEAEMESKLRVTRGAVSLLNIASVEKPEVTVIVDNEIFKSEKAGFHPSINTETLVFETKEIPKILNFVKAEWKGIDL